MLAWISTANGLFASAAIAESGSRAPAMRAAVT
jgi:hypothetical protein